MGPPKEVDRRRLRDQLQPDLGEYHRMRQILPHMYPISFTKFSVMRK